MRNTWWEVPSVQVSAWGVELRGHANDVVGFLPRATVLGVLPIVTSGAHGPDTYGPGFELLLASGGVVTVEAGDAAEVAGWLRDPQRWPE